MLCVAFAGAARLARAMGVRSDLACLVAATAYARSIPNQDNRVEVEREAGRIMNLAK